MHKKLAAALTGTGLLCVTTACGTNSTEEVSEDAYVEKAAIVLHDNYVAWDIELSDRTEVIVSSHDLEILDSGQ